jgi:hypothetical protein
MRTVVFKAEMDGAWMPQRDAPIRDRMNIALVLAATS